MERGELVGKAARRPVWWGLHRVRGEGRGGREIRVESARGLDPAGPCNHYGAFSFLSERHGSHCRVLSREETPSDLCCKRTFWQLC